MSTYSTLSSFGLTKNEIIVYLEAIKHKVSRKDAKLLFASLNPFVPSRTKENQLDILIVDEAHRIGKTSNNQFTKPLDRTNMPQVEQLIR